jgi:hypothetical protein
MFSMIIFIILFYFCEVAGVHLFIVCLFIAYGIINVWNDETLVRWGSSLTTSWIEGDDYENDLKNWMLLLQSKVKLDAHIHHGKFNQVIE